MEEEPKGTEEAVLLPTSASSLPSEGQETPSLFLASSPSGRKQEKGWLC